MAADIKTKYGTSNQTITISPASVTTGSSRQSTVIDNSTNLFIDALVTLKLKSGASGTTATGYCAIFAYATTDGGTTYTESASGTDGSMTLVSPTNLILIGTINMVANATTYVGGPMSVAAGFGGSLPQKWGIVIQNNTGGTLDSTAGNHVVQYQGVLGQTV